MWRNDVKDFMNGNVFFYEFPEFDIKLEIKELVKVKKMNMILNGKVKINYMKP